MKKFFAVLMLLLFSAGAFAQTVDVPVKKFDPYASIRMFFGYHNTDPNAGDSELDMVYRLQTNSRFGAKMELGDVKAHVELGLNTGGVNVRLAYATYDAGIAQIKVGQDYTPYTWSAVGDYADDCGLGGFGVTYDARQPQVVVSSNGFYISFINPSKVTTGLTGSKTTYTVVGNTDADADGNIDVAAIKASTSVADTTVVMPKTAIGYDYKDGNTVVGFGAAMNMVKINDEGSVVDGENIVSYVAYLHANIDAGSFVFRGNVGYSQNAGNFGMVDVVAGNSDTMQTSGTGVNALSVAYVETGKTSLKNATNIEGYINPMFKVSPEFMIGAGYGYAQVDRDDFKKKDAQQAYFIDAKYSITKNFSVLPEFSYRDFMKDKNGVKQGKEYYAGAQIQLNI